MPHRFSFKNDLTSSVNAPLLVRIDCSGHNSIVTIPCEDLDALIGCQIVSYNPKPLTSVSLATY
jgi:hypothetical protein